MDDNVGESTSKLSKAEPAWVSTTLRFLPAPVLAVTTVIGCLIVAAIFLIQSLIHGDITYWFLFGLLAFFAAVVSAASVVRRGAHRGTSVSSRYESAESKPTLSIVVLMVWIYSWLLTIGMLVFGNFFRNGPGTTKYYVTLGIAVIATLFMKVRGLQVVRQHFGTGGGRNVILTGTQALIVIAIVLAFGLYCTWLMV